MDQLIFASLSHTHYWYEVGMFKVSAVKHFITTYAYHKLYTSKPLLPYTLSFFFVPNLYIRLPILFLVVLFLNKISRKSRLNIICRLNPHVVFQKTCYIVRRESAFGASVFCLNV